MALTERQRTQRNINPHKEAIAAMTIWGAEYATQGGGSMDFWDWLSDSRKRICRELIDRIEAAPRRANRP